MATQHQVNIIRQIHYTGFALLAAVFLNSCSQNSPSGGQAMRLSVGQVREITLPKSGSDTTELTGTSDNSEVVDVTPKPNPAESGTNTNPATPTTFLVKGVTAGTARVVFTEKQPGDAGPGKTIKTYSVRVKTK